MDGANTECATPCPAETSGTETVILLHGSASSSEVWQPIARALEPRCRVVTPDLIGYGAAAAWSTNAPFTLDDEVAALHRMLPQCGGAYHLVGYSYGGAVALELALADPARIKTLTLIEPVVLAALRYANETVTFVRFCRVSDAFTARLARGERDAALQGFVDFWAGEGAWAGMPEATRAGLRAMAETIVLNWQACLATDPGADRLAALAPRTLLIRGDRGPAPMLRLVDALHGLMPGSRRLILPGGTHQLPASHGAELAEMIAARLHATH
jgi:pimeloyl-ACP methyl ester carboxylesterase